MSSAPDRPSGPRSAPAQAAHTPVQPPATSLSVQPQPSNPLIQAQARPAPLPAGPMPSIALFSRPNPGVQGMSNLASLVQSRASTGQIQAPSNPQSGPHAGTLTTPAQLQRPGIHAPAAPHSAPAAADGAANARQQPRRRRYTPVICWQAQPLCCSSAPWPGVPQMQSTSCIMARDVHGGSRQHDPLMSARLHAPSLLGYQTAVQCAWPAFGQGLVPAECLPPSI